jgi:hypothetical protein
MMRILTSICRWLSSAFIALLVSTVAFVSVSMLYERFGLQKRLGVDDDVCWLALVLGPALIVVIHRALHERAWVPISTLVGGLALAVLGWFQFWSARATKASHVPSGPFSGIEHDLGMLLGVFLGLIAAFAVSGAILALLARRMARPGP